MSNRLVPNPYLSGQIKPYGFLSNIEKRLELLSIDSIAFSCKEWSEEPHYASDTDFEAFSRLNELFEANEISKTTFHEVLSISLKSKCKYEYNEEVVQEKLNGVFGEHGYSTILMINGREKEVQKDILRAIKENYIDDQAAYDQMMADDKVYFKDMILWEAPKPLNVMEDISVNYFGQEETLNQIKDRIHKKASSECSGLDTVYQAKLDIGVLNIADKLERDFDDSVARQFIIECGTDYKSIAKAKEELNKAYKDYQDEYCL